MASGTISVNNKMIKPSNSEGFLYSTNIYILKDLYMGQRLIISESEKNKIKGLYENHMDALPTNELTQKAQEAVQMLSPEEQEILTNYIQSNPSLFLGTVKREVAQEKEDQAIELSEDDEIGMEDDEFAARRILHKIIQNVGVGSALAIVPAAMFISGGVALGLGVTALAGSILKDAAFWKKGGHHYKAQEKSDMMDVKEQGLRPGMPSPKGKTSPPGSKFPIDPKLSAAQNIQKVELLTRRQLTPLEINKLTFDLNQMKKAPKRSSTPSVDKNDLTGDNKGEGVNLYGNDAQTVLQYSATIDKIVKSGSGFDIFVSGDYDLADKYFHWASNAPYFQAFLKSTRKPLTWDYNGKTMTQKLYNKEFSNVLQKMLSSVVEKGLAPVSSTNNAKWDFTSPMNEQSEKIGAVTDGFGTIKEIIGLPVMFFADKEGKIPYGNKVTISKVTKDPTYSTKFRIYFKELGNDYCTFECGMKAFLMKSKGEWVYNTQLLHALSLPLCNSELKNNGKVKSVPNVKYAKNDTQGAPSQTDNQTIAESKQILIDTFNKLIN